MMKSLKLSVLAAMAISMSAAYADTNYFPNSTPAGIPTPPPAMRTNNLPASNNSNATLGSTAAPNPSGAVINPSQAFGSLMQALAAINQDLATVDNDVKNNGTLATNQWNNFVNMQANQFLYPAGNGNYLENVAGFQSLSDLATASFPASNPQQTPTVNTELLMPALGCGLDNASSVCNLNSFALAENSPDSLFGTTQLNTTYNGAQYVATVSGLASPSVVSGNSISNAAAVSMATEALNQIAATRTVQSGASASQMQMMQAFVNNSMQQSWINQLSTATMPQLLQTVAVQLAYNNYMQYQRYQQEQTTQALLAMQLYELNRIANTLQNKQ